MTERTERRPKVWMTTEPRPRRGYRDLVPTVLIDPEKIAVHGELTVIFSGFTVAPYDTLKQERTIVEQVLPFSDVGDMVLTCGPQVMVATLIALMMREHGSITLLVWDRAGRRYVPKVVGHYSPKS